MTEALKSLIDEKDYDDYDKALHAFLQGDMDPHRFVGIRLNLGIYAQRQDGMCMVRSKLPGGRLQPRQLLGYAEAAENYSGTTSVHITTRQDIQFHFVPLERTGELQRHLGAYGIASREACGNTVRNITSCGLAGACPAEHVDTQVYLDRVARHFIRHPLTAAMPRKFKMAFSGCESDCAHGLVQDIGVLATHKNGRPGFKLLAAGGLGGKPKLGIVLESFIEEAHLIPAIEAVLSVHDKHSDRKRKMRSRIKFLVEKFGEEEFISKYRIELERTLKAFHAPEAPLTQWRTPASEHAGFKPKFRTVTAQHQDDLNVLPISVPNGEVTIDQLRGLADLLIDTGLHDLRTTSDQNLSLFNVPTDQIGSITVALKDLGFKQPRCGDRVVSCPGTATCPLGITASRHIAPRLSGGVGDLGVSINGCHNTCANATISDIGLTGKGKRHHGRLIPSYTLELGGNGSDGGNLGLAGPDIPAVRVPTAVSIIHDSYHADRNEGENFHNWVHREGRPYFDELLSHLSKVGPMETAFLTRDHGDSRVFKVESMGVGECAGADAAASDKFLLDAQYESDLTAAFASKNKQLDAAETLENQVRLVAKALLDASGKLPEEEELGQLVTQAKALYPTATEVFVQVDSLYEGLLSFQETLDELQLPTLMEQANDWNQWAKLRVAESHQAAQQEQKRSGTEG